MPRIKEVEVYEFDELSDEAKEKAKDRYKDNSNYPPEFWDEAPLEDWRSDLADMGFEEPEVYYSGFSSQGDGASFVSKGFDFEKFFSFVGENSITKQFNFTECKTLYPEIAKAIGGEENQLHRNIISLKSTDSRYSHEGTVEVSDYYLSDWFSTIDRYPEDKNPEIDYDKLSSEFYDEGGFLDYLEGARRNICHAIYKNLEAEYDWWFTDEAVIEEIQNADLEFNEDGTLA